MPPTAAEMSNTTAAQPTPHPRRAVLLVFFCTVIGAAAQMLMKIGATTIPDPGPWAIVVAVLTHPALFAGYCLYGVSTLLLVLALREGELSLLYPVIALTYVWVTLLSVIYFKEHVNLLKGIGLASIIAGVTILGRNQRR